MCAGLTEELRSKKSEKEVETTHREMKLVDLMNCSVVTDQVLLRIKR